MIKYNTVLIKFRQQDFIASITGNPKIDMSNYNLLPWVLRKFKYLCYTPFLTENNMLLEYFFIIENKTGIILVAF